MAYHLPSEIQFRDFVPNPKTRYSPLTIVTTLTVGITCRKPTNVLKPSFLKSSSSPNLRLNALQNIEAKSPLGYEASNSLIWTCKWWWTSGAWMGLLLMAIEVLFFRFDCFFCPATRQATCLVVVSATPANRIYRKRIGSWKESLLCILFLYH